MHAHNRRLRLLVLLCLLVFVLTPQHLHAARPRHFQLHTTTSGTILSWSGNSPWPSDGEVGWTTLDAGDHAVPARLVTLRLPDGVASAPIVNYLSSAPSTLALPARTRPTRRLPDGSIADAPATLAMLPDSPITVLREGRQRGQRVVVYAFTPLIVRDGVVHVVTDFSATLPDSTPASPASAHSDPFLNSATPPHALLAQPTVRIAVTKSGIQQISADALREVGIDIAAIDLSRLQLLRNGSEHAIEVLNNALRFYAPAPGDRWNNGDTYWLSMADNEGLRIVERALRADGGELRSSAIADGTWRNNRIYESRLIGADGDPWYAAELRTLPIEPGETGEAATLPITLGVALPLADGTMAITVTGSSLLSTAHKARITVGDATLDAQWSGRGIWQRALTFNHAAPDLAFALLPSSGSDTVHIDSVSWHVPVQLDFSTGGAEFSGVAGTWRYQLANIPAQATLYDITLPSQPQRLSNWSDSFADGPDARRYILVGNADLHTPVLSRATSLDLSVTLDAEAIYLAPTSFHAALEPLLAHRRAAGYRVALLDPQDIYDNWSHGQLDPAAIRRFLQYAAANWATAPQALVLVGDGTSDPLNFTGRNNTNWLPPYLLSVDPWIGETACESCYGQLDGDSPLDDALPDLAVGRLPVKSAEELADVVAKILRYESAAPNGTWRSRVAYIADNADSAGDFAAELDAAAAELPSGISTERVYYDPDAPSDMPWRTADAWQARLRTIAAFNQGAGLLVYAGHGLQYQWAVTGPPLDPNLPTDRQNLLFLYDPDTMHNSSALPIVLSLTCLSGMFQQPAFAGTTVDERLVLNPQGGAIASWSSTGFGISYGHMALQRGFTRALWQEPLRAPLGYLIDAGYYELFTTSGCCQETLRTFALLGDPLTPARVAPNARDVINLPIVRR